MFIGITHLQMLPVIIFAIPLYSLTLIEAGLELETHWFRVRCLYHCATTLLDMRILIDFKVLDIWIIWVHVDDDELLMINLFPFF